MNHFEEKGVKTALAVKEDEVLVALAALGLSRADIEDAIGEGERARSACHPYDPPTFPGNAAYAHRIRRLRALLVPEPRGWIVVNDHSMPFVMSPDHRIAITTCRGDSNTANPNEQPRSQFKKGPLASAVINQNVKNLEEFFPGLEPGKVSRDVVLKLPGETTVYYLLVDRRFDGVHAELSAPVKRDKERFIVEWGPRIILGLIPAPAAAPDVDFADDLPADDDDNLDISVSPVDGG